MDASFPTAKYASYTTEELKNFVLEKPGVPNIGAAARNCMRDEIARRAKRDAGDVSVMTAGERLRALKRRA